MTRDDYLKNIPFAPGWIVNPPPEIRKGGKKRGNLEVALTPPADETSSRARSVLDKVSGDLASEITGSRNDALNKAAFTMGGFIAGGSIDRAEVIAALTSACHRNGLAKDDGPASVEKTIASGIGRGMERPIATEDATAAVHDRDDIDQPALAPKSELALANLTNPPGLVGEIIDWIEDAAEYPSREAALGAAIGIVATIAGRGVATPSQARTNFYMILLAESGYGKNHPGTCANNLLAKAGLDRFIGPSRFMSASGLRKTIMAQPSVFCIQDEFGGILRQIDGPNVGVHNATIRTDLLGYYSLAEGVYAGAAYAESQAEKVFNPNLSLLGMSTPSDFWSAVTSARGSDGFLPRFLLFNIETPKPKRVKPKASKVNPPDQLIEKLQALYSAVHGSGDLVGGLVTGARPFGARVVDYTDEASTLLDDFDRRIGAALELGEVKRAPFLSRAREHAMKLALTVAVGDNPHNPAIELAHMRWAVDLAWVSTCAMILEAETKIADNERQRIYNLIYDHVRKAGPDGIAEGRLRDRLSGTVRKSDWKEIIEELHLTGRVLLTDFKPKTGRPSKRYVAREFVGANDNIQTEERRAQSSP